MIKVTVADWLASSNDLPKSFECEVVTETAKALLVELADKRQQWLPKSQVKVEGEFHLTKTYKLWSTPDHEHLYLQVPREDKELAKSIPGYAWDPEKTAWEYPHQRRVLIQTAKLWPDLDVSGVDFPDEQEIATDLPLFPFQRDGVKRLVNTPRMLLGDDMGLGKTLQAIATCEVVKAKHVLVICPNSLKWNWEREVKKWAPTRTVAVVDGWPENRVKQIKSAANYTIINYEGARIHEDDLLKTWDVLIVDEAHAAKNRDAKRTKAVKHISSYAKRLYLVTGTPIMNRASELWSLLNMIDSKSFRSYWKFVEKYCDVEYNGFGYEVYDITNPSDPRVQELQQVLASLMVRRLKHEVIKDMPSKTVTQRWIDLEEEQQRIYDDMERKMLAKLKTGEEVSVSVIIAQIMRLKQIAVSPSLMLEDSSDVAGAKIDALMDIIEELGEKKLVVFSQFARAITRLHAKLTAAGVKCEILVGDVPPEERVKAIERFQTDPTDRVFLATTQAGGVGVTLTAASTAVFLDKCWTPALNIQAQDRIHRIGQTEPVTIIELLARKSVEVRIERMLAHKQDVFDVVVEGAKAVADDDHEFAKRISGKFKSGRDLLEALFKESDE